MARAFPILYVADVERSAGFYAEHLGFVEDFRLPPTGSPGYIGLHLDDARLGIVDASWPQQMLGQSAGDSGPRFELFVYVDDVDAAVARVRAAGVTVGREPETMAWGERMAYLIDPDGNPVVVAARVQ